MMPLRPARSRANRSSACIDSLEQRRLLSTVTWTGTAGDGEWTTAGNWQGNVAPVAADSVIFPAHGGGSVAVNISSPVAITDIEIAGAYDVNGSAITLNGNILGNGQQSQIVAPVILAHNTTATINSGDDFNLYDVDDTGHHFGLTKRGAGRLLFVGSGTTGTYTGTTDVVAGTFQVDTGITGPVIVEVGGYVDGEGSFGTLTSNGGTISLAEDTQFSFKPIGGDLTLHHGTTLREFIDGDMGNHSGKLIAGGSIIRLSGVTFDVSLTNNPTLNLGDTFTMIENNTGAPVVGTFAHLPEGGVKTINGVGFQVSYVGGSSGHDVTLTIVPPTLPTTPTIASATSQIHTRSMRPGVSVLGADSNASGEAGLTYAWSTVSAPAGAKTVKFSDNGTNTAKNLTARFQKAGVYHLACEVTNIDGNSATADVRVVVKQSATQLILTPHARTVHVGDTLQYAATVRDQFNHAMRDDTVAIFAVSGNGTIGTDGLFTATSRGHVLVDVTDDGLSGSIGATVLS